MRHLLIPLGAILVALTLVNLLRVPSLTSPTTPTTTATASVQQAAEGAEFGGGVLRDSLLVAELDSLSLLLPTPGLTDSSLLVTDAEVDRLLREMDTPASAPDASLENRPLGLAAQHDEDGRIQVSWATIREFHNSGFEVEVVGPDGTVQSADFLASRGTEAEGESYTWSSDPLAPGRYRVRLRQLGRDGVSNSFPPLPVEVAAPAEPIAQAVRPRPEPEAAPAAPAPPASAPRSTETLALAIEGTGSDWMAELAARADQRVQLTLLDGVGRPIRVLFSGPMQQGQRLSIPLPAQALESGRYLIRLEGPRDTVTREVAVEQ